MAPGGPTLSNLIEGTRQALNDISEQLMHGLQDGEPEAKGFLSFYRERTGRDWWADAGDPIQAVRGVLRRGRIRNETEWYLVESIVSQVDQPNFSAAEMERLEAMRRDFEERVQG